MFVARCVPGYQCLTRSRNDQSLCLLPGACEDREGPGVRPDHAGVGAHASVQGIPASCRGGLPAQTPQEEEVKETQVKKVAFQVSFSKYTFLEVLNAYIHFSHF